MDKSIETRFLTISIINHWACLLTSCGNSWTVWCFQLSSHNLAMPLFYASMTDYAAVEGRDFAGLSQALLSNISDLWPHKYYIFYSIINKLLRVLSINNYQSNMWTRFLHSIAWEASLTQENKIERAALIFEVNTQKNKQFRGEGVIIPHFSKYLIQKRN